MQSIFTKTGCGDVGSVVSAAVATVVGRSCSYTIGELLSMLKGKTASSLRALTPFDTLAPLSQAFPVPYAIPLPFVVAGSKQISIMKDVSVQISAMDLLLNPVPAMSNATTPGPDVNVARSITFVNGEATADNFPFISNPQYTGTTPTGVVAYQSVIPILGTIFKISWTESDDPTRLVFGRLFTNVPNSKLEIARIVPQDESCRQLSFFVPFCDHRFENVTNGTYMLRYFPADYIRYYDAGDDVINANPSLMPWYFDVMQGSSIVTTGTGWSVEAIPVPITEENLMKFWPTWTGNHFSKD